MNQKMVFQMHYTCHEFYQREIAKSRLRNNRINKEKDRFLKVDGFGHKDQTLISME